MVQPPNIQEPSIPHTNTEKEEAAFEKCRLPLPLSSAPDFKLPSPPHPSLISPQHIMTAQADIPPPQPPSATTSSSTADPGSGATPPPQMQSGTFTFTFPF